MSEQAKHTPGPWYLSFDGGQRDAHVWANADMMACVASVHPGVGEERDEFAHNARLIAAAPQLLAACEAVMDWYDRDGSVGGAVDPMEQLSAAIKAARTTV